MKLFKDTRLAPFLVLIGLSIDMGGGLGFRIYFLIAALALSLFNLKGNISIPSYTGYFFALLCVYPFLLLFGVAVGNNNYDIAISQYSASFFGFILLIFFYQYRKVDLLMLYFQAILLAAILVNVLAIGVLLDIGIFNGIVAAMADTSGGYFGQKSLGNDSLFVNIYLKSTLFFPSAFVLAIYYRKPICAIILISALIFSFSKSGIALCTISIFSIIFIDKSIRRSPLALACFFLGFTFVIFSPILIDIERTISGESETGVIRIAHLDSVTTIFKDNVFNLLFGFGLGSEFYSSGAGGIVSNIEIDHINTIRKYGLIWFIFFIGAVIFAIKKLIAKEENPVLNRYTILVIAVTFIGAGTNPVLISPLFFALIFLVYSNIFSRRLHV